MLRLFTRARSAPRSTSRSTAVATKPKSSSSAAPVAPASAELLEGRTLFAAAPHITSIVTDNRGEVILNTQRSLDPATVNTRSVQLYSTGPDGIPLTADDVKMRIKPKYTESNRQLRIRTFDLPADATYWVKVSAKQVKAFDGAKLDGEFNGAGLRTGNNVGGGDLLIVSKRDKGTRPVARFSTNLGAINVSMFKDLTPQTYANFVHYANEAAWDGTFFHRSIPGFIVQGGGFDVSAENEIGQVHQEDSVVNEPGVSNTRGRIAMAKIPSKDGMGNPIPGGGPNSATNQWFFNLADNRGDAGDPNNPDDGGLDFQNGGFTAFGEIVTGLDVVDAIAGKARVNEGSPFGELPINDASAYTGRGSVLDPQVDVISIRRIAILNKVSALVVP
ncbi:MAG: peptidylprolyl isomerase [Tepidisphaeraceae bacterium]